MNQQEIDLYFELAKSNLSPHALNNLSPYTLNNLSPYTLNNLSPYTLNNLSPDTLNNLSPDTLNNLSPGTLKNLSPDTLNNLSPHALNNLNLFKELSEKIPVLEKPYTNLLADINEKKRTFKQSTFGDIRDYDPELNVCGSAMCTAGHLVHMAGKAGYGMMKIFGYEITAAVIHYKVHPDIPHQNFSSIPQIHALGYITKMAQIESGVIKIG